MNQHASSESGGDLGDLMGNLERAVGGTQGTIVVMDEQGGPLMRVWCLLEVWTTMELKGLGELHIVMSSSASKQQVSQAFKEASDTLGHLGGTHTLVTWQAHTHWSHGRHTHIGHLAAGILRGWLHDCLAGCRPDPTHGITLSQVVTGGHM